nr:tRNA 2-thiouridine(34) synthase MnmA [Geodermatophilaceae bacterium]
GQRRGLHIGRPAADGRPRYVLSISPVTATVTVGPAALLDVDEVRTGPPVWTGAAPSLPFRGIAQLRAHGAVSPARADATGTGLVVVLDEPQRGVAAGQALVLYDDDRVVGSATVESARLTSGVPTAASGAGR